jgi:hypothetical protein
MKVLILVFTTMSPLTNPAAKPERHVSNMTRKTLTSALSNNAAIAAVDASRLPMVRSIHPEIIAIATPIVAMPNVDC